MRKVTSKGAVVTAAKVAGLAVSRAQVQSPR